MSNLIQHIEKSLELSNNYQSKITEKLLTMSGMSGKKLDIFIIIFVQFFTIFFCLFIVLFINLKLDFW